LPLLFKLNEVFDQLILGKIINTVATGHQILWPNAPNSILAGAPLRTPLVELTALPQIS